jgi:hypothetical protein
VINLTKAQKGYKMKKIFSLAVFVGILSASILLCSLFSVKAISAAEVEKVEDSDIPEEFARTIETKGDSELKVIPMIDVTALGTYSGISGGNDMAGVDIKGTASPVVRIDRKNYIIPLYYGAYRKERQITVEEEGGRIYNEIMDHNGTIEYKHIFNEKVVFKLDGLGRFHYVKEPDYDWDNGLYNYRDLGVGTSVEYFFLKDRQRRSMMSVGGEFYNREYPNYQSLISLASVTAPETNEKDYRGYRAILKYTYTGGGVNCDMLYSPLYKDFDDKKVINSNGILTSDTREDWFHYGNIRVSYLPKNTSLAYGLRLTGILVDSNQNYYDSGGTISLTDDIYTENYYSFKSITVNPSLTYLLPIKDKKAPATFTAGYSYLYRDYDDRKAQEVNGNYTTDNQTDKIHNINFQATYPLNDNISLLALGSYTMATSNMKYQTYYQYRYNSVYAGGGIRVRY